MILSIYVMSGGDQCIIFKRSLSLDNKRTSVVVIFACYT